MGVQIRDCTVGRLLKAFKDVHNFHIQNKMSYIKLLRKKKKKRMEVVFGLILILQSSNSTAPNQIFSDLTFLKKAKTRQDARCVFLKFICFEIHISSAFLGLQVNITSS